MQLLPLSLMVAVENVASAARPCVGLRARTDCVSEGDERLRSYVLHAGRNRLPRLRGREAAVANMRSSIIIAIQLAHGATAFMATAQRWPTNASGLWRPEEIALRGGAMSALWELPDRCARF